jgi:predicted TPR repeat methyltransferase
MEPTEQNRRAWDEIHQRRAGAVPGLPPFVRAALGDLHGKRVLHVPCRTGEATAELAELGATATGVGGSPDALAAARERWPAIAWVQSDVEALPAELQRGRFDLVYAEEVLSRLDDLGAWARAAAAALHPGGELLLFDEHPVSTCVDGFGRWSVDYFADPVRRLGQVVAAVAQTGLVVRALEEYPAGGRGRTNLPGTFLLYARKP